MSLMRSFFLSLNLIVMAALAGCGEPPLDKAIVGTWAQDTPTSTTADGLQTTTKDTVLRIKKTGETYLTRNLDIIGSNFSDEIKVSVELKGQWTLNENQLTQTPQTIVILARGNDTASRQWADELQSQAENGSASVKTVIAADKKQLILQDAVTGATDVYRRK